MHQSIYDMLGMLQDYFVCVFLFPTKSWNKPIANAPVCRLHWQANSRLTFRLATPLFTIPAMLECRCKWMANDCTIM